MAGAGVIPIAAGLTLDEQALEWRFVHASGPGGQNVNKVATAVQLRFDLAACAWPEAVCARVRRLAGRRLTQDGVLVIAAQRFRSQERNRADALERLLALLREAAPAPVRRVKTRPTGGSVRRRLEGKQQRATTKRLRGSVED